MVKFSSDLMSLHTDNLHFFLHHHHHVAVSMVSILKTGKQARVLFHLEIIFQHILVPQIDILIWFSMLSLALVSRQYIGKYQILTYFMSCGYVIRLSSLLFFLFFQTFSYFSYFLKFLFFLFFQQNL